MCFADCGKHRPNPHSFVGRSGPCPYRWESYTRISWHTNEYSAANLPQRSSNVVQLAGADLDGSTNRRNRRDLVALPTTELCLYIIGYIECVSTHFWQLSPELPQNWRGRYFFNGARGLLWRAALCLAEPEKRNSRRKAKNLKCENRAQRVSAQRFHAEPGMGHGI